MDNKSPTTGPASAEPADPPGHSSPDGRGPYDDDAMVLSTDPLALVLVCLAVRTLAFPFPVAGHFLLFLAAEDAFHRGEATRAGHVLNAQRARMLQLARLHWVASLILPPLGHAATTVPLLYAATQYGAEGSRGGRQALAAGCILAGLELYKLINNISAVTVTVVVAAPCLVTLAVLVPVWPCVYFEPVVFGSTIFICALFVISTALLMAPVAAAWCFVLNFLSTIAEGVLIHLVTRRRTSPVPWQDRGDGMGTSSQLSRTSSFSRQLQVVIRVCQLGAKVFPVPLFTNIIAYFGPGPALALGSVFALDGVNISYIIAAHLNIALAPVVPCAGSLFLGFVARDGMGKYHHSIKVTSGLGLLGALVAILNALSFITLVLPGALLPVHALLSHASVVLGVCNAVSSYLAPQYIPPEEDYIAITDPRVEQQRTAVYEFYTTGFADSNQVIAKEAFSDRKKLKVEHLSGKRQNRLREASLWSLDIIADIAAPG